jgi:predicted nucleotidyltransferase
MEIKEIRKAKGLTQKEAASVIGISFRTYQNYENGRSSASSFTGRTIAEKLSSYEAYTETSGILPLAYIKENASKVFAQYSIDYAVLFGSYSKNEAGEKSDVDLLISGSVDGLDYFSLIEKVRKVLHKKVDILRFQDLKNNQALLGEILATGIRIYSK